MVWTGLPQGGPATRPVLSLPMSVAALELELALELAQSQAMLLRGGTPLFPLVCNQIVATNQDKTKICFHDDHF